MLHLIGLAGTERLPRIMAALGEEGIAVRGLFGEASRAVGAFAQVSATGGATEAFAGAVEYLVHEEREARNALGATRLDARVRAARELGRNAERLGVADALRVLGLLRLDAVARGGSREVDAVLATLDVRGGRAADAAAVARADRVRELA